MGASDPEHSIWARAVADPAFRDALIDDPLRAVAGATGIRVSAEQIRQLEEMDLEERERLVKGVVREVHARGGFARFGWPDARGRLGGNP